MNDDLIVFVYDHFYPDFSAGGPVTSLYNLAQLLKERHGVRIITSTYEYQSGRKMTGIRFDCWTDCRGLLIWYASDRSSIKKAVESVAKDHFITLYLNGMFSPFYFLYPLWLAKKSKYKVIISPRGMLQQGAMKRKRIKKEAYLLFLRLSGLLVSAAWHATDKHEAGDIKLNVGVYANAVVVPNVPLVFESVKGIKKEKGVLRLVYFSLITEKKNLLYFLELLNAQDLLHVELDIIGPVKDKPYWNRCEHAIRALPNPARVQYKGEINPERISEILPAYHGLVLPTHGENFGHAIVEMLACSRPVLISDKTPWNDITEYGSGYAVELDKQKWVDALKKMINWNQEEFDVASASALNYYQSKFNFDNLKMRYLNLFSNRS